MKSQSITIDFSQPEVDEVYIWGRGSLKFPDGVLLENDDVAVVMSNGDLIAIKKQKDEQMSSRR